MSATPCTSRAVSCAWLLVLILIPMAPGCGGRGRGASRSLTIATATAGGTYFPVGRQLAAALERVPEGGIARAWAWTTHGSSHNIKLLGNPPRQFETRPEILAATDATPADLAFVGSGTLSRHHAEDPRSLRHMRALAAMQLDVVQLVVPGDPSIRSVGDLADARVYMGKDGSGTRWIAEQLLGDVEPAGPTLGFTEAVEALRAGKLDAAVFVAGTPTEAVASALEAGFRLLPLPAAALKGDVFQKEVLPPGLYAGQDKAVSTVSTWTILCCRRHLDNDLVKLVLDTLHDEIDALLLAHAKTQNIRLDQARERIPTTVLPLHRAAARFWVKEHTKLRIATGNVNGRYYRFGRALQKLLAQRGIAARAIHTHGSVQNLELLQADRPTLALLQHDVALAARWDDMKGVYDFEEDGQIVSLKGMLRIASLHEEKAHILLRRNLAGADADVRDVSALEGRRISIGPDGSGSRLVGKAILGNAGLLGRLTAVPLSMHDTVGRLRLRTLDGAIMVCAEPSSTLLPVLSDCQFRLLAVDSSSMAQLVGRAFAGTTIKPGIYRCQEDGRPVATLSTHAVLVANEHVRERRVEHVTEAIIEGLDYLPGDLQGKDLVRTLPSLPLHPGAQTAYEDAELLPSEQFPAWLEFWLNILWKALACVVIVLGLVQGLLKLRRDSTANRMGREVNRVSIDSKEPHSVERLRALQNRIRKRVARRWWRGGEINRARWLPLNELIEARMTEARENLTRGLIAEIRALKTIADPAELDARTAALRKLVWTHLDNDELTRAHVRRLLSIIEELRPSVPEASA